MSWYIENTHITLGAGLTHVKMVVAAIRKTKADQSIELLYM